MYKNIVLAYDGSREGRAALREGALLGLKCGAQLHLLAVVNDSMGVKMAEGVQAGAADHQIDAYKALLQEAVDNLDALGVRLIAKLISGEPAVVIAGYAEKVGAELVVVGHRRQNILERWWSGPTGAYLCDALNCSLLIGRTEISQEDFQAEMDRLLQAPAPVE